MKTYNPSDKKHMKKLHNLNSMSFCPLTRPSDRAGNLGVFKYTVKEAVKNMFIKNYPGKYCICSNKGAAFYIGTAYKKAGGMKICYTDEERLFCATCLENGSAASKLGIYFNSYDINSISLIDMEKGDELKENNVFYFKCLHCNKALYLIQRFNPRISYIPKHV